MEVHMSDDMSDDMLDDLGGPLTEADLEYGRGIEAATFDSGRVLVEDVIAGNVHYGLWNGRQIRPHQRQVLISYCTRDYVTRRDHSDYWFRYEAPGIAPLVFFGYRDGVPPPDARQIQRLKRWGTLPRMAVIEVRPEGERLSAVAPLSLGEAIRLGLGLCDTLLGLNGQKVIGLHPETIFVAGEHGNRYYAGATPRSFQMLGVDGMDAVYSCESFDPPTYSMYDRDADELVYTVALVIWFALLKTHAFRVGPSYKDYNNTWNDIRAPFTGPPELGRLLEAVLVADVEKRMKAPELREELAKLAAQWGVEPPPFPPPGLA
jgi:hypothetical protein